MPKLISNIVFTKNRPLQLEAYLESLYRYFPAERIQTYIVYKVELFHEEYELVFKKYSQCIIITEKDFHTDIMNIINRINTDYILFGIDDVVYFDSVNLDLIDRVFKERQDIFGFTFRFNPESLKDGHDAIQNVSINNETVYSLNWTVGQTPHSRYPFELCCTIYKTQLVRRILKSVKKNSVILEIFTSDSILTKLLRAAKLTRKILKLFGCFYSPNTLESWPCRWCRNNRHQLPDSTYFKKLCASAVQVNMVNTSNRNEFDGTKEFSVERLNEKYIEGYRFDVDFIADNKPDKLGCDYQYFKLKNQGK
jgi:hypothetical protein